MALHDYGVLRTMACGIAGSVRHRRLPRRDQVRHRAPGPRRDGPGHRLPNGRGIPRLRQRRRPRRRDRGVAGAHVHRESRRPDPGLQAGEETPVTSPEMSAVLASMFVCPGTGCSPPLPRKRCCGTTAATPGTYGTWPSSSTPTGTPAATGAPGYLEQCRQLTAARAEHPWLAAGSQTVQQQALRDFTRAMTAFFDPANPAGRPSWRKAGRDEGFRIVGRGRQWDVRRVSRKAGQVWVPKAGWVMVPLVPRGAAGREVLPGHDGPGRPLACRLRRDPRAGPRARLTARSWGSTGAWRSRRRCPPGRCCTARS